MAERVLVLTDEDVFAWKIARVPYGSEGARPRFDWECPYFLEHGQPHLVCLWERRQYVRGLYGGHIRLCLLHLGAGMTRVSALKPDGTAALARWLR